MTADARKLAGLYRRRDRLWNRVHHAEAERDRAVARVEALIAEILVVGAEIDALMPEAAS